MNESMESEEQALAEENAAIEAENDVASESEET